MKTRLMQSILLGAIVGAGLAIGEIIGKFLMERAESNLSDARVSTEANGTPVRVREDSVSG